MSKVTGKRYTYKFDFHGLMQACQQLTTVTSAETLAMSSSTSLHLAYIHRGGQVPPLVPASPMVQQDRETSIGNQLYRSPPPYWLASQSSGSPSRIWNAQSDGVPSSPQMISSVNSPSVVTSQCSILYHK